MFTTTQNFVIVSSSNEEFHNFDSCHIIQTSTNPDFAPVVKPVWLTPPGRDPLYCDIQKADADDDDNEVSSI